MCVLHTYGVCASVCSTSNTTSHYNPKYCNLNCESIGYPFQIILYFISPCFLLLPSNKSLYIFNWFCAIEQHRFFFFVCAIVVVDCVFLLLAAANPNFALQFF